MMLQMLILRLFVLLILTIDPVTALTIYAVSGFVNTKGSLGYPVLLWRINPETHKLDRINQIVDSSQGAQFILQNSDSQTVAIGYPAPVPKAVAWITAKDLSQVRGTDLLPVLSGHQPVEFGLFEGQSGPTLAIKDLSTGWFGLDLASSEVTTNVDSQWQDLIDIGGQIGGPEPGTSFSRDAKISSQGLIFGPDQRRTVAGSLPASAQENVGSPAVVVAANRHLLAFRIPSSNGTATASLKLLYVLNRQTKKWTEIPFMGEKDRVRCFGSWLTFVEGSTGDPKNKNTRGFSEFRGSGDRMRPDQHYWYSGQNVMHRGLVNLFNISTGRSIQINMKTGDSEILFIGADEQIVYRDADSIYQASIKGSVLADPRLLCTGDEVRDVHWLLVS